MYIAKLLIMQGPLQRLQSLFKPCFVVGVNFYLKLDHADQFVQYSRSQAPWLKYLHVTKFTCNPHAYCIRICLILLGLTASNIFG